MHIFLFIRTLIHLYIYIYIYICIYIYVHVCVQRHACSAVHKLTSYTYMYVHRCISFYTFAYVHMYIYIFLTFTLARSLFLALDVYSCIYIHVSIYVFTLTFWKLYHRAHVNTFAPCLPNSSTCACVCMCTSEHVCVNVCVCGCIVCVYMCDLWTTRFHQVGAYIHSRNGALVLALWVFATSYHQDEYIHTDMRTLTMPAPIPFVPPVTKQFLPANVYRLHVGSMGVGGSCMQMSHLGLGKHGQDEGFQCVTYIVARNSDIFTYTHISQAQYCDVYIHQQFTRHASEYRIRERRPFADRLMASNVGMSWSNPPHETSCTHTTCHAQM